MYIKYLCNFLYNVRVQKIVNYINIIIIVIINWYVLQYVRKKVKSFIDEQLR